MDAWKEGEMQEILRIIEKAEEPLETKEVVKFLPKSTRVKVLYRLNHLRADNLIKGKQVGAGKGAWIWWKK